MAHINNRNIINFEIAKLLKELNYPFNRELAGVFSKTGSYFDFNWRGKLNKNNSFPAPLKLDVQNYIRKNYNLELFINHNKFEKFYFIIYVVKDELIAVKKLGFSTYIEAFDEAIKEALLAIIYEKSQIL